MRHVARILSIVGHPIATMLLYAATTGARAGVRAEAILVAMAVILPVAIAAAWYRATGRWRTVDASDREDRPALYGVGLLTAAAVLAALVARGNVLAARSLAGVLLVFAAAAALNRRIKTSLHVAFAVFCATALLLIGSPVGLALAALVPPLAWSRVRLGRHTTAEVAAGAALGVVAGLIVGVR